MVYLGVISYGIYLWHEPWIDRYLAWTGLQTFTVYTSDIPFAWHTSRYVSVPFFSLLLAVLALDDRVRVGQLVRGRAPGAEAEAARRAQAGAPAAPPS